MTLQIQASQSFYITAIKQQIAQILRCKSKMRVYKFRFNSSAGHKYCFDPTFVEPTIACHRLNWDLAPDCHWEALPRSACNEKDVFGVLKILNCPVGIAHLRKQWVGSAHPTLDSPGNQLHRGEAGLVSSAGCELKLECQSSTADSGVQ